LSKKVAVIAGAGPAGLTAAYELLKRTDIHPIVYEMSDALGGIARTHNYKGNRIDIGGHRFFSRSERVMKWWFNMLPPQGGPAPDDADGDLEYAAEALVERLCDPEPRRIPAPEPESEDGVMLQRRRLSRIFYRHHLFPYPLGLTLSVARRLGYWNTFRIGLSYLKAQALPIRKEIYLDQFFINRFGRRLYETFFKDYTEKVWGVPCTEIKAEWGAQRIKGLSLKRALVHAVKDLLSSDFQKRQQERETSLITRFWYPKYGPGQMWEAAAEQIREAGGEIVHRREVVGVRLDGDRVTEVTVRDLETGEAEAVPCDYFFSTMPIKQLVRSLVPEPPAHVAEVAEGLVYRDFLTVGLLLRKLHVEETGKKPADRLDDNWIYIQDGGVRVGRVQFFNNWSPYLVADRENTVWIGLEYFVTEADDLWSMPDADLIALGVREMEKVGLLRGEDVLDGCVLRMPKAYPAYFGSYDRLYRVRDYVEAIPNLFLIGRNGMHRYNNQDHSMLTAMLAVDNILEGRTDKRNLWDVNLEMVYHEENGTPPNGKTPAPFG
jgi:protoporphyrinogen oxidase